MAAEAIPSMDQASFQAIGTVLNQGYTAAGIRRVDGADHYAENLRYDYLFGKNSVSFREGTGQRIVGESGSGRTRAETNAPGTTAAHGP